MNLAEIIALVEGRKQPTSLVYHGTSSAFVRTILKTGLMPDPTTKSWGNSDTMGKGKESLYGVYVAPYMGKAISAAEVAAETNGGNPVLITVQYVSGSGGLDEDNIAGSVGYAVSERYDDFMQDFDNAFNSHVMTRVKEYLPATAFNRRSVDLLKKLVISAINYTTDHREEVESLDLNPMCADPKFRQALKLFTESVKIHPSGKPDRHSENIKVTRPIGFSGKTKIIKIEDLKTKQIYYP